MARTRQVPVVDSSDDDTVDYVTVQNNCDTDETVSVLFARFERALSRIERLERDVHLEQRSSALMEAQLHNSKNLIATLTERVRVLEAGRSVGMVDPYSAGDEIEVLNFRNQNERFGTVSSCRGDRVYFRFRGSGCRT